MFKADPWGVVDYFDSPEVLDAAVTSIPGSGGAFLQVVASLYLSCYRISIRDGIQDRLIGLYVGAPGSEALAYILGMDPGRNVDIYIPKGSRISLRSMGATAVSSGDLCILFMGHGIGYSAVNDP